MRVYAIGDIHGCSDLLDRMVNAIRADLAVHPAREALTVTLGDYVDRGPDSRGVLDRLARNPFPTAHLALKGNHEQLLAAFLRDPATGPQWLMNGGGETLHSYDVPIGPLMTSKDFSRLAAIFQAALPREHLRFLSELKLSFDAGSYFLCHAGIRPGVPFDRQSEEDLLWIREDFLNSRMDFGKVVVHGHTPADQPEILPNRINIDTGAVFTGRLTCVALEGASRRFLSTA
jgi:diadenosine tetraphosphatase ApaH/serine/threonine PP2A family protein phosphatase